MNLMLITMIVLFAYNIVMAYVRAENGNGVTMVHCTLAILLFMVMICEKMNLW